MDAARLLAVELDRFLTAPDPGNAHARGLAEVRLMSALGRFVDAALANDPTWPSNDWNDGIRINETLHRSARHLAFIGVLDMLPWRCHPLAADLSLDAGAVSRVRIGSADRSAHGPGHRPFARAVARSDWRWQVEIELAGPR